MEMRPRTFLWIALAIAGLMVVGWVSKPPSLKQKIKIAGVHLALDPNVRFPNSRETYSVPKAEVPQLVAVLIGDGYADTAHAVGGGKVVFHDLMKGKSFPFLSNGQHVRVFEMAKCQVFFDYPLK